MVASVLRRLDYNSGFEKNLSKANKKRAEMLADRMFSVESGMGRLAIVVSDRADHFNAVQRSNNLGISYSEYLRMQIRGFEAESERIKAERGSQHELVARLYATDTNFSNIFSNPLYSDVVLIGHGSISSIWTRGEKKNFDWQNVSKMATHLKRGVVEQRMCGAFPLADGMNVPLGTFAVSQLSNLRAATGMYIADDDPGDAVFTPVYNDREGLMYQIQNLNQVHRVPKLANANGTGQQS